MKETKDKKKFKIHKYYIISVVLLVVFVIIPWQYLKFSVMIHRLFGNVKTFVKMV